MSWTGPKPARLRLDPVSYETLRQQVLRRDPGGVNRAVRCQTWRFITNSFAADPATTPKRT